MVTLCSTDYLQSSLGKFFPTTTSIGASSMFVYFLQTTCNRISCGFGKKRKSDRCPCLYLTQVYVDCWELLQDQLLYVGIYKDTFTVYTCGWWQILSTYPEIATLCNGEPMTFFLQISYTVLPTLKPRSKWAIGALLEWISNLNMTDRHDTGIPEPRLYHVCY